MPETDGQSRQAGAINRQGHGTGPTELNVSPHRAALVEICADAWQRDLDEGLAPETDPDILEMHPWSAYDPKVAARHLRLVSDPAPVQLPLDDWPEFPK